MNNSELMLGLMALLIFLILILTSKARITTVVDDEELFYIPIPLKYYNSVKSGDILINSNQQWVRVVRKYKTTKKGITVYYAVCKLDLEMHAH